MNKLNAIGFLLCNTLTLAFAAVLVPNIMFDVIAGLLAAMNALVAVSGAIKR